MLKPQALANAATTVGVVAFVICGIATFIAPDLVFGIAGSWAHSINLEAVRSTTPMSLGSFILGVITFGIYIWVITFAGASLYNKWAK